MPYGTYNPGRADADVGGGGSGGSGPLGSIAATDVLTFRTRVTGVLTNSALVSFSAGQRAKLTRIVAKANANNTGTPSVLIGFAQTTTPTGAGVVLADGGMAAGSGIGEGGGSGIIATGADGDDLLITCTDPGGDIEVFGSYFL